MRCFTLPFRNEYRRLALAAAIALGALTVTAPASTRTDERLDAAARAESAGQLADAARLYRRVLETDRLHDAARDGLRRVASGRTLPVESAALDDARGRLPARFLEYETARFLVLSDAEPSWSREQAQRLERAYHQFHRFARRQQLEPLPLRHKLVCVLFDRRDEYQRFAVRHDEVDDPWIAGYYAPATDRVVFYRGDSNPSVVDARARLREMSDDIDDIKRDVRKAEHAGAVQYAHELKRHRQRYEDHVRSEQQRVEDFAQQINIATVVHEAVHQLMFHTGLQSPRAAAPLWFSEGLATAFESDGTRGAFGPDHEYAPRREAFDELLRTDGLLALDQLVRWDEMPVHGDDALVHQVYHQSYALVTWMSRFRKRELTRFVESLLVEPGPRISAARHHELFEQAFGAVATLERRWLRHERDQLKRSVRLAPRDP